MSLSMLSMQCDDRLLELGGLRLQLRADHESCPGGYTTPGVLGGWVCNCPCHRPSAPPLLEESDQ